jgi:hypothetical protein
MHIGVTKYGFDQVIRATKIQCTDACDVLAKKVGAKISRS